MTTSINVHGVGRTAGVGGSPSRRREILGALANRWPTVVGALVLLLTSAGGLDPHVTAMVIILAAMCYLAAAAFGSRRSAWAVLLAAVAAVAAAKATGWDPTTMLLVAAAGFGGYGLLRGPRIDRGELGIQAVAFVGFAALGLTAMTVAAGLAVYLAALASIGHGVWDVIHHHRDKVVTRSFAEYCAVLDFGLGAVLLAAAWIAL